MVVAVDFDGILVSDKYPEIGEPNIELINKIKSLQKDGHKFILWTCRNGELLEQAINYLESNFELIFDYVNSNSTEKLKMYRYNDTRKVGADYYIDDKMIDINKFLLF